MKKIIFSIFALFIVSAGHADPISPELHRVDVCNKIVNADDYKTILEPGERLVASNTCLPSTGSRWENWTIYVNDKKIQQLSTIEAVPHFKGNIENIYKIEKDGEGYKLSLIKSSQKLNYLLIGILAIIILVGLAIIFSVFYGSFKIVKKVKARLSKKPR